MSSGLAPGTLQSIAVEDGTTIEEVLDHASLDASGFEVRRNGSAASLSTEVADGDTILLVRQIKGN